MDIRELRSTTSFRLNNSRACVYGCLQELWVWKRGCTIAELNRSMKFWLFSDLLLIGSLILFSATLVFSFRTLVPHHFTEWSTNSWMTVLGGFMLSAVVFAVVSRLRTSYHCSLAREFSCDYNALHSKFDFEEGEYGIEEALNHVNYALRIAVIKKEQASGLVNRLFVGTDESDQLSARLAELRAVASKFFEV